MQADTAKIDGDSATLAGPKVRLQTLAALDGRTIAARRTFELIETFLKDLGGRASAGDMLSIRNAAMLVAILEDQAAKQLAGEATDVDQLVRLSDAARRAVAALNLPKRDKRTTGPTLQEYLDAKPQEGNFEETAERVRSIDELFKRARETPFPSLVARAEQVRDLLETARRRRDAKRPIRQKKAVDKLD